MAEHQAPRDAKSEKLELQAGQQSQHADSTSRRQVGGRQRLGAAQLHSGPDPSHGQVLTKFQLHPDLPDLQVQSNSEMVPSPATSRTPRKSL
eukprot:CAMPEP_0170644828 /NCGR_PEP_ID=MMETSP0224-20130122/42707_1 /TAXON_ID=285029 /ORGANISM="Togula jolla, Strain CCCM 725" /LENGTH=91 /DNA_ID=CAMNT_0010975909 /DNA_START=17 /DNA_END=289 /DNA_ORIENTATION=-